MRPPTPRPARLPLWLLEGFADYVALRGVGLPPSTIAVRLLSRVHDQGPPHRLPRAAAFGAASASLGRAYQEAWLACRLIAARFGQAALVRLYHRSMRVGLRPALQQVLHIDRQRLTRLWRANLERLADG